MISPLQRARQQKKAPALPGPVVSDEA